MKTSKNNKELIIQEIFIDWYSKNKRDLPWRKLYKNKLPNPYHILVSEYMLQQTTVKTVVNRFNEFLNIWPRINDLSMIHEKKILKFWSGLGYYNRAKNLLKTAKIISRDYKNKIPHKYENLINLPGIGEYTAKAIQGIAYNQSVLPIDTNIERIIARLYGIDKPITQSKKIIKEISKKYKSLKNASILIQAFMDYGSIICLPRKPNCHKCLIKKKCISYKKNLQNIIPIKIKSNLQKRKKYSRAYIFYNEKNEIIVRKRPSNGMLPSMLEVPNDNWVINKKKLVNDKIINNLKNKIFSKGVVQYSFSHFDLEIEVFIIKIKKNTLKNQKWLKLNNINSVELPTVMKKIVNKAI